MSHAKKTSIILAFSIFFNLALGAVLYQSYQGYQKYKTQYTESQTELGKVSDKYLKQQDINNSLYKEYKELKEIKTDLTGKNEYLRNINKNLNRKVKSLSTKKRRYSTAGNNKRKKYTNRKKYKSKKKYKRYKTSKKKYYKNNKKYKTSRKYKTSKKKYNTSRKKYKRRCR